MNVLEIGVEHLDFEGRNTPGALKRAGIDTLRDLVKLTPERLKAIRGVSAASASGIPVMLESDFQLRLGMTEEEVAALEQAADKPPPLVFARSSVYVVHCQTTGLRKIGYSVDVSIRFAGLCTSSPTRLILEHVFFGCGKALETALHVRYARQRRHGEWFMLSDLDVEELLAFVESWEKELAPW